MIIMIIIIIIIITIIDNGNLAMDIPRGGSSFYCFHQNLECLFLWRDENRQEPTSTQPTCQIQLYYYLFQSQHETRDLLKNATHFWLTSTHPAPHTLSSVMVFDGIVSQSSAPRVISHSHQFSSVTHFSLGNLIKLTLCFAGRKQQFGSQLFASHPLNAFVCSCLLVNRHPMRNKSTLLNNWKSSFTTILPKRLLLFCIQQEIGKEIARVLKAGVINSL